MKVYITEYALTRGIIDVGDAELCRTIDKQIRYKNSAGYIVYIHKPHWYKTKQEAIARAEKMRTKKIESLKKQIAKLENMRFE